MAFSLFFPPLQGPERSQGKLELGGIPTKPKDRDEQAAVALLGKKQTNKQNKQTNKQKKNKKKSKKNKKKKTTTKTQESKTGVKMFAGVIPKEKT